VRQVTKQEGTIQLFAAATCPQSPEIVPNSCSVT